MGKVSFTHLIGYAVVRADRRCRAEHEQRASSRAPTASRGSSRNDTRATWASPSTSTRATAPGRWWCPSSRTPTRSTSPEFLAAYEELIRKVKANKLTVDDFQGANVTLTNPGTIGTVQSVPRLMPGQGVIVGVGSIDYPAEFQGADRAQPGDRSACRKVVTITSTYDHRIIQGAESGLFLKRVHELLLGEHGFYDDIFHDLDMPYEAVKWRTDHNPIDREEAMLHKQMQVATLIRVHRVRGHLIADLDPLHWKEPDMPIELDPATYGLTIWDLDREFLTGGVGGHEKMELGDLLGVLRDAYCRTIGVEYMHIQDTDEQRWIQSKVEVRSRRSARTRSTASSSGSTPPRRSRSSSPRSTSAPSGSGSKVPSRRSRSSTRSSRRRPTPGSHVGGASAWPTAAGSTCCPTSSARATRRSSASSRVTSTPTRCRARATSSTTSAPPASTRARTGADIQRRAGRQPQPPRDRRPDRDGHGARRAGPHRAARLVPGAADPDPRRRRLRRPGRRRRDAGDERHHRLPRRRHDPPDHQQPDRLHHAPGVRPLVALLQRRRQDGAGADLPRQRRRPRGVRARGPARVRVPPDVPQGRRDRHGAATGATVTTRATIPATPSR